MLQRIEDWFSYFNIHESDAQRAKDLAAESLGPSAGMMALGDFHAMAAALLHHKPKVIFEIGTHMGATSNFFLQLLPKVRVVSMDFIPATQLSEDANIYDGSLFGGGDGLELAQVGSLVSAENRARFTQLIGDSHQIVARDFTARHGLMDFVFIDGDLSHDGMVKDTALAKKLVGPKGAIGWHNANPKRKYSFARTFLEQDLDLTALATADNFIGGVAFWTPELQARFGREMAAA